MNRPAVLTLGSRDRAATKGWVNPPIWAVLVVLAVVYAPFLAARLSDGGAYWFVHMGRQTLKASRTSTRITPALGWQSNVGYDGQYYFALALDPLKAKNYMPPDDAGFVYSRPVYPALAGALGYRSATAVPYAMLLLNLLAVGAGTLAVAAWLRRRRRSAWFALLYGLFPGLLFCVFRDLTEPLAFALVALGGLAIDRPTRKGVAVGALLFALAALTRETTLPFAGVAALAVAWRQPGAPLLRRCGTLLAFLTASVVPLLLWRIVVGRFTGNATQERGDGTLAFVPFHGIGHYWPWDAQHWLIVGAIIVPTLVTMALAAPGVRDRGSQLPILLLALNAAAFVVFLPAAVDVDFGAASRAALGIVLSAVVCIASWGRATSSSRGALVALAWSLPWYVAIATALGLPALALVTS